MKIRKRDAVPLGALCFGGLGLGVGGLFTLSFVPYGMRLESACLISIVVCAAFALFGAFLGLVVVMEWSDDDPPDDPPASATRP
ncbi:MAG: hypothetical protein WBC44_17660 [Planctomycetaceae bacterium]